MPIPGPFFVQPIVSLLFKRSVLRIDNLSIDSPTPEGFSMSVEGKVSKAGPFPAKMRFKPKGKKPAMEILWEGEVVAIAQQIDDVVTVKAGKASPYSLGPMRVKLSTKSDKVHSFLAAVLNKKEVTIRLRSLKLCNVVALGFGFSGITLDKTVPVAGLSNLNGVLAKRGTPFDAKNSVNVEALDVVEGVGASGRGKKGLKCTAVVELKNPSATAASLGAIGLVLCLPSKNGGAPIPLGHIEVPAFSIRSGSNKLNSIAYIDPEAAGSEGRAFISDFINSRQPQLLIIADEQSDLTSPNPWVRKLLGSVQLSAVAPKLPKPLIVKGSLALSHAGSGRYRDGTISIVVTNPFSSSLTLNTIRGSASAYGIKISTIDCNLAKAFSAGAPTMGGKKDSQVDAVPINVDTDASNLIAITQAIAKEKKVDLTPVAALLDLSKPYSASAGGVDPVAFAAPLFENFKADIDVESDVVVGDYPVVLHIKQDSVPVTISKADIEVFVNIIIAAHH